MLLISQVRASMAITKKEMSAFQPTGNTNRQLRRAEASDKLLSSPRNNTNAAEEESKKESPVRPLPRPAVKSSSSDPLTATELEESNALGLSPVPSRKSVKGNNNNY
jgi:hypothetical protein